MKLPSFITIIDTAWGWNLADFFLFHQIQIHEEKKTEKMDIHFDVVNLSFISILLFQMFFPCCARYV